MSSAEYAAREPSTPLQDLEQGTTTEAALAFFDSLPAVAIADMIGSWRGSEIPTGHPFDGLLDALGWHGKSFDTADAAHPLIFQAPGGGLVNVNPALVPLRLLIAVPGLFHNPLVVQAGRLARPLLRTGRPKARLRMMEYRGVVTATMEYDGLPINDSFRAVGPECVLGAMDARGLDRPYMFALRREARSE